MPTPTIERGSNHRRRTKAREGVRGGRAAVVGPTRDADSGRAAWTGSCLAAGCGLAAGLVTTPAAALWGDDAGNLTVGGSARTTTAIVDEQHVAPASDSSTDGMSYSALRLTAAGDPAPWFRYDLHLVQDAWLLTSSTLTAGGLALGDAGPPRYRLTGLRHQWVDDGNVALRLAADRAWVEYQLGGTRLTLGRQAITFGKARFWNPLDVFLPFDAQQIDREYKRGVDAIRLGVPIGMVSGLDLVATPGRVDGARETSQSWYGSAALARLYTNVRGWDVAVQGGKIYGGYQVGGAVTGVVGPVEIRGEGAYFLALDDAAERVVLPDHFVGVVGVGRRFDSSLDLEAEYFYNGAGDDSDLTIALERVAASRALQMSEHLVGAAVGYDLMPLLNGTVGGIVSASDGSGIVQPGLTYSVSDESDFLVGAVVAWGPRPRIRAAAIGTPAGGGTTAGSPDTLALEPRSEFGTYPNFYYAQYRFYF